jgi:hypothetical protein
MKLMIRKKIAQTAYFRGNICWAQIIECKLKVGFIVPRMLGSESEYILIS